MSATPNGRFQSGDCCPATGSYGFDGFVDDPGADAPPSICELEIWLFRLSRFPIIHGIRKRCYWKSLDRTPFGVDRFQRLPAQLCKT